MLREWSAISHIDAIEAPIFIYHGLYDFNVHYEQSDILESALKRKGWEEGVQYRYIKRKNEMHGTYNEADRIALFQAIDEFLKPYAPAFEE